MTIPGVELSIIVPTLNEGENISTVVQRLDQCLQGVRWEVIFVDDDSSDNTVTLVNQLAIQDQRVRSILRIGRRGLSSACIEGMLASSAPYLAVMDADLQHDENLLLKMFSSLKQDDTLDIVVGSRYVDGGEFGLWNQKRYNISQYATRVSRLLIPSDLKDPMSGFFMLRREVFLGCVRKLSGFGFKILLDLFVSSSRPLRFIEFGYIFRKRQAGTSKLDSSVIWDYGMLILDKLLGRYIPVRLIAFSFVGGLGVLVHLLIVGLMFRGMGVDFITSLITGAIITMTFNYTINNLFTFRDLRLHGWQWFKGLISFILICSIGATANIGIASYLFTQNFGWSLSALAGTLVGVVWNYVVTMLYTWKSVGKNTRKNVVKHN